MTPMLSQRAQWALLAVMMLFLAATRYNHFFTQTLLPDATWAAFFLAGLAINSRWAGIALMTEVLIIDLGWRLFTGMGSDNACVSPAYPLLVVAYGSLWFMGMITRRYAQPTLRGLASTYAGLSIGVALSFLISNWAWYSLSGNYADMAVGEFAGKVGHYFFGFWQGSLFWTTLAIATWFVISRLQTHKAQQV